MDNNIEGKQEGKKYDGLRVEVSLPEDASGLAATPNTLTGGTGGSQSHLSATKQNRLASEDNYTPSPGASARFDFMQESLGTPVVAAALLSTLRDARYHSGSSTAGSDVGTTRSSLSANPRSEFRRLSLDMRSKILRASNTVINMQQELMKACANGDMEAMETAIVRGADVNWQQPPHRYSPLHRIVALPRSRAPKKLAMVESLMLKGASVHATTLSGLTPLHLACFDGDDAVVRLLCNNAAMKNIKDKDGKTPLHWAVENRQLHAARVLVDKGVDVSITDENGETALHACARKGSSHIVNLLLNAGADPTAKNKAEQTPLNISIKSSNADVTVVLLRINKHIINKNLRNTAAELMKITADGNGKRKSKQQDIWSQALAAHKKDGSKKGSS